MAKRPPVLAHERWLQQQARFTGLNLAERFRLIHADNFWGSDESVSGLGSALQATGVLRRELPLLLERWELRSMLDLPCGDYGWMQHAALPLEQYIGADIVPAVIEALQPKGDFRLLDLTRDALPRVDVVFCRDCLVHLSYADIAASVANLQRSGSAFLLTTHFTDHDANEDIESGDWRVLNFTQPPFHWPAPLDLIVEQCEEADGGYRDKTMALWRIADLT
jgi:hypothetical protein